MVKPTRPITEHSNLTTRLESPLTPAPPSAKYTPHADDYDGSLLFRHWNEFEEPHDDRSLLFRHYGEGEPDTSLPEAGLGLFDHWTEFDKK